MKIYIHTLEQRKTVNTHALEGKKLELQTDKIERWSHTERKIWKLHKNLN